MMLSHPPPFDSQAYWDQRASREESFDWLVSSERFVQSLEPVLPKLTTPSSDENAVETGTSRNAQPSILHLGCGNSSVHVELRGKGHADVVNVDYSPAILERCKALEASKCGSIIMDYVVEDATKLTTFITQGQKFPLVIDKSTADAIACGSDEKVQAMAQSIFASLEVGGVWISLSFSANRYQDLDIPFDVSVLEKIPLPKGKPNDPDLYYYVYALRPKKGSD